MTLFAVNFGGKISRIRETRIAKELDIQKIFEDNLPEILRGVTFLESEFLMQDNKRIDTLGIDSRVPVIIEYKKNKSTNIIRQGVSYLDRLVEENQAEFKLLLLKKKIPTGSINWKKTYLVGVAEDYDDDDFRMVRQFSKAKRKIRLLKYAIYSNNILLIEEVGNNLMSKSSSPTPKKKFKGPIDRTLAKPTKERGEYFHAKQLEKMEATAQHIYEVLEARIMSLDPRVTKECKKLYITYTAKKIFVSAILYQRRIRLIFNVKSGALDDPAKKARDLRNPNRIGHWGAGDYDLFVREPAEIDAAMKLVKQSFDYNH